MHFDVVSETKLLGPRDPKRVQHCSRLPMIRILNKSNLSGTRRKFCSLQINHWYKIFPSITWIMFHVRMKYAKYLYSSPTRSLMVQSIPNVLILPWAFVGHLSFCFRNAAIMPHSGAGRSYKNPRRGLKFGCKHHPGTTPKLCFAVNKLQIPNLWEISNNLIKTREAPCANRP